jgi:hypothetical protein
MKKLILFLGVLLLLTSCGRLLENWLVNNSKDVWMWHVRNDTEQTLKLKFPSYSGKDITDYRTYEIEPRVRIQIDGYTHKLQSGAKFGDYFKKCASVYGDDVTWQISSVDDVVLKTWKYSERDQPDQRFFIESSWETASEPHDFTFAILPEDITPTDQ